jgi:cell wall-associated NlpC family hydrolase
MNSVYSDRVFKSITNLEPSIPWALINRPLDDLRSEPSRASERVSQALLGEAARLLEVQGDWSFIRLERDGYPGWIHTAALYPCSQAEVAAWQATCQAKVIAGLMQAWPCDPTTRADLRLAGKLPFGVGLPVEKWVGEYDQVRLPDGRTWWVANSDLLPLERRPYPDAQGIDFTLKLMQRFVGVPYLWGGRTPYGFDCSGFSQAFWDFMGVNIPRDADLQYQAGLPVEGAPQPGDLFFFGEANEDHSSQRFDSISHVAISIGDDEIIHSNGTAWGVSYNSLNPERPGYRAWLHEHLIGVRWFGVRAD